MTSKQFPSQSTPQKFARTIKIEEEGDFSKKRLRPKIRLMGYWLERAGFTPGGRVHVIHLRPGIIELRTPEAMNSPQEKSRIWEQSSLALG